jgi:Uncharacterized protein conserved in archaea
VRKDEILLETSTLDEQLQDISKVFASFVKASPDVEDKQVFSEMLAWADGSRELLQGIQSTVSPTPDGSEHLQYDEVLSILSEQVKETQKRLEAQARAVEAQESLS